MKDNTFYNPITCKSEPEIRIARDDIEQALSWFDRLSSTEKTVTDRRVYRDLRQVVARMRSLDIE
jgi:hypothetical protein